MFINPWIDLIYSFPIVLVHFFTCNSQWLNSILTYCPCRFGRMTISEQKENEKTTLASKHPLCLVHKRHSITHLITTVLMGRAFFLLSGFMQHFLLFKNIFCYSKWFWPWGWSKTKQANSTLHNISLSKWSHFFWLLFSDSTLGCLYCYFGAWFVTRSLFIGCNRIQFIIR